MTENTAKSSFDYAHAEMMKMTTVDYAPFAGCLHEMYKAFKTEGFTPSQSLELVKTFFVSALNVGLRADKNDR